MEVRVVVDNRVRIEGTVDELVRVSLRNAFSHENPEWMKKKRMNLPVWGEPKIIATFREEESGMSFPRGGFSKVSRILREAGVSFETKDAREYGVENVNFSHRLQLYPYQENLVRNAIEKEQCLVRAPTGSGKTSALLAITARVKVPTLVLVHSQALLDQWKERAQRELGLRPSQIGIVQGRNFALRGLTLSIQKTMAKVAAESEEVRNFFGCVLADEVHLFAAKTFYECVDPFPARYRIGVSADHRRKDRKEFLIHDLFGEVAADIPREELVASGHVLEVEIRAVPTNFAAPWYGVSEGKEDEKELNFVRLVKEMADDPERNWEAIRIVREEVARGEQVFVMAHEREHCMRLGQMLASAGIRTGYLLGGPESAKEFAATIAGMKAGTIRVGVGTYKAIGTGIDVPRVGVAVGVTPIAGNQQFFGQVRGRVCRTASGKTGARLYVLWDSAVYPKHLKNLLAWNDSVVVRDLTGNWVPGKTALRDWEY